MSHIACRKLQQPQKRQYILSEAVENILKLSELLTNEEYHSLTAEIVKKSPCSRSQLNIIKNIIVERNKTAKPDIVDAGASVSRLSKKIDLGAEQPPANITSPTPFPVVPFIYRGNLVSEAKSISFDVEKLEIAGSHRQMASTIAVVNEKGKLLLWAILHYPDVCKYYTNLTGITKEMVANGETLDKIKPYIVECFSGKVVIGTEINRDLESLNLDRTSAQAKKYIDVQDFFLDSNNQKIVSQLTKHFFGFDKQNLKGQHSAIVDARLTMLCHVRMMRFQQIHPDLAIFRCPVFDEERANKEKAKTKQNWEKCRCGYTKPKKYNSHFLDTIGNYNKVNAKLFDDNWEFGGTISNSRNEDEWE